MYGVVPTIVPAAVSPEDVTASATSDDVPFNRPGESEVEDLDMALVCRRDIRRLQVAVGDLLPMRCRDRVGQRHRDVEEPRRRESAGRNALVERAPSMAPWS